MRAPDQDFVAYSDEEWAKIRSSLATLSIDVDTVMVGERPLHEELVEIARIFSTPFKRLTPKQKAKRHVRRWPRSRRCSASSISARWAWPS